MQDCLVLREVLEEFGKLIWKMFKLNIHKYPTAASLTFAIFRSNFLDNTTQIPVTDLKTYDMLRPGYTGGSVDVYRPFKICIKCWC